MSDKSPRKTMGPKSGKSIEDKGADNRSMGVDETLSKQLHMKTKK
jgi:hypothetical protein